ncbi:MAG: GNAT family N-acetyltransferase [candidate division WOR-3 bacterium]
MIRRINKNETKKLTEVIRNSFVTVANEFNITKKNAPSNPAFITPKNIKTLQKKGVVFLGFYINDELIGCIALENAGSGIFYIEKLGVLPEFRNNGYGEKLMIAALKFAKKKGCTQISVAIINKNKILKKWYKRLGFKETGLKDFPHLPFTVCFMEKKLSLKL